MVTPVRTRQTSAATKSQILDAAQRRFEHYGMSKVTMDEIANDVGMSKASLYYYFPTKESLFKGVFTREHEKFIGSITAMAEGRHSAAEKIQMFVEQRFEYFLKLMNLHILDLRIAEGMRPNMRKMFQEFAAKELHVLRRIVQEGKSSRQFTLDSSSKVAEALFHVLQGLRLRFIRTNDGPPTDLHRYEGLRNEFNLVTSIFLRGLCRK